MTRPLLAWAVPCLAVLVGSAPAALAQLPLTPGNCSSNSVLPSTYQFHQETNRWMGVAVSPQNPTYSVHLEMLAGPSASYSPAVVSTRANGTNFLLRNFAGQPDAWCYAKALNPLGGNAGFVAQWDPGSGALPEGGAFSATYGGLALGCELLRVFDVYLAAGQSYAFTLTTSQPADDVKLALAQSGSRPDGWVTRQDGLFEHQADPEGAATAHVFTAQTSGNYALAVFVDDLTALGGTYTVGFTAFTPPVDLPDLVVSAITPATVPAGTAATARVQIKNLGGGAAPASTGRFSFDYGLQVQLNTPSLAAGDSTLVAVDLGTLTVAGQHTLWASADHDDLVAEADESNNARTETLTVTSAVPTPDLVVTSVAPATAVPDQPFSVFAVVFNRGTADAAASTTRLDVDPGWASLDLATPAVPAGATFKVQGVMPGVPAGGHTLRAVADWSAAVAELDEGNNILAIGFTAEGPDLVVQEITPTEVFGNVAPIYSVTVRNLGNGAAAASAVRLTVDGVTDCAAVATPALAAGAAAAVACTSTTILAPGVHTVEAVADAGSAVPESDETNNRLAVAVTATATSVLVKADGTGIYPTIQAAVDAVAPGGEVLLAAGNYTGAGNRDITFRGKDVAVVALPGGVTIDCQGDPENEHRAFLFTSGETPAALVRGVTVKGGWSEYGVGGGVLIVDSAPTLEDCVIHACHADRGGAVAFAGSPPGDLRPRLLRCTLTGNSANMGGAASMEGTVGVMMDNVLIAANYGYGGAIVYGPAGSGTLDLDCCDLWGNGGGDYAGPAAGQLGADGNISQNPLFCDAAGGDFHVASNSPC
ncbi:MAG: CARDB domain-containing protein, partial [Candidatus Krumholzibacteriia bacterium]